MSTIPTPRTNDQIGHDGSTMTMVRIEFARTLERELSTSIESHNLMVTEYRKEIHEAQRQVEASDNLYRKMCAELTAHKADAERLAKCISKILPKETATLTKGWDDESFIKIHWPARKVTPVSQFMICELNRLLAALAEHEALNKKANGS